MNALISNDIFRDFLCCKYKAYLNLAGEVGHPSDFEKLQAALLQQYRCRAENHLLASNQNTGTAGEFARAFGVLAARVRFAG